MNKHVLFFLLGLICSPLLLWAAPPKSYIRVSNGNKFATSSNVTLEMFCPDAEVTYMMISNNADLAGGKWVPYERQVGYWELIPGEGARTVYAKYKNKQEQETEIVKDEIIVDVTPPSEVSIKIESVNGVTNKSDFKVTLKLGAKDANGVKFMAISNNPNFYNQKFQPFAAEVKDWPLDAGDDGPRHVYVKFRDAAQNESAVVSDKIVIDRIAPVDVAIKFLTNGQEYVTRQDKKVDVNLFARGADSMMVSQKPDLAGAVWEPYRELLHIELEGEDGPKMFYAKLKDIAGNTTAVISGQTLLDITPPKDCTIQIDNNAPKSSHPDKMVELTLAAKDAELMMISNVSNYTGARWEKYVEKIKWKLEGEVDGVRVVYVKFKDKAGNISASVSDDIILERGINK